MNKNVIRLLLVLTLCGIASVRAAEVENPRTETEKIVSPVQSEWTTPPSHTPNDTSVDGPLLGNGDLAVTFAGPPQRQQFYITKNDFWKLKSLIRQGGPRPLATLEISTRSLKDAEYHVEQSYYNPITTSEFRKDKKAVEMRCWVAATTPVLVVELSAREESPDVAVTLSPCEGQGAEIAKHGFGNHCWVTRKFVHDVDIATEAAVAMKVIGADETRFKLEPGQPVTLVLAAVSRFQNENYLAAARQKTQALDASSLADLQTQHANWWADYWAQSYADIGDDVIAHQYYRSLYVFGACSRDLRFPPGIFGSWVTTDKPAWEGDYHLNYNYQAPFYGLYSANHLEQADPHNAPLLDFMSRGRWYAEHVTNTRGVLYPVGIGPLGIETTRDADVIGVKYPNLEKGGLFWQQRSNAAYALVNVAQRWRCTYDLAYAKRLYPFVLGVVDFWEDYLRFEDDCYVIDGEAVHEGSGWNKNSIVAIALIQNALDLALDMSESLGTDADRHAKWRHIQDHLSTFGTQQRDGKTVFRYTEDGPTWWGDNTLGIQHIYPAGAIGLDSDPKLVEISRNTIAVMNRWHDGNGSNSFFPAAVRVGWDPNAILTKLAEYAEHTYPNGFQKGNPHGIENCSTVPNTINEMLCMSHGHVLRVFGVWPKDRDARFYHIRTWDAFLVSSALQDGQVQYVELLSERGRPCTIVNPWPGRAVQLYRNDGPAERLQGPRVTFPTAVNETIVLKNASTN